MKLMQFGLDYTKIFQNAINTTLFRGCLQHESGVIQTKQKKTIFAVF